MSEQSTLPDDLTEHENMVSKRIRSKIADYVSYGFSATQSCALNIFFDLAQEFEDLISFHLLPVQVLKHFLKLDAELYVRGEKGFDLVTTALHKQDAPPVSDTLIKDGPTQSGAKLCIPVRGRFFDSLDDSRDVLGVLVIYADSVPDTQERLFLEKFANRLGFSMHNRILAQKNKEHIAFARNLVQDIGHNVIGPNMHFKLLINQLEGKINTLGKLGNEEGPKCESIELMRKELNHLHLDFQDQYQQISQQFQHTCLFLESLLRESHFAQGHFVLRPVQLDLLDRVVNPQFQHYLPQFTGRGIKAELRVADSYKEQIIEADLGLISQVLANLFANAVKYTQPDEHGQARMLCMVEYAPAALASGDGIIVSVLTSGPHIKEKEAALLFEQYFRASNTSGISGTGNGLHFTREIIQAHKGRVMYSAEPDGNLFAFILPI